MSQPKFSIITPSYNQADFIEATLRSVREQQYDAVEHIVVDGGSTDRTTELLKIYDGTYDLRWISEPDGGQSDALNKGLAMAGGDIIGWVNSDDTYLEHTLATAATQFEDPEVEWMYGDGYWTDAEGRSLADKISGPYSLERLILRGMFITQPAMFIRRSLLERVGGIDGDIHTAMDYDLCLRLASQSPPRYVPSPLATRRVHDQTKSATLTMEFHEDSLRALDKFMTSADAPPGVEALRSRAISTRCLTSAYRAYNDGQLGPFRRLFRRSLTDNPPLRDRRLYYGFVLYAASLAGVDRLAPEAIRNAVGRGSAPGPDVTNWWARN